MDETTRIKRAKEIIANPRGYWVCECCESIVVAQGRSFCNCGGYHFDRSPKRVQDMALMLMSRPQVTETITWED
jgi:hypothetical protein